MKHFLTPSRRAVVAALSATAAVPTALAQPASGADARFATLSQWWIDRYIALNPTEATQLGDHRGDHRVSDISPAGRRARTQFAERALRDLGRIDRAALSRANQVDAAILENEARSIVWTNTVLEPHAWDPITYQGAAGDALYSLMARDYAPAADRLRSATRRMRAVADHTFTQARAQLVPARVPPVHAQTYSRQNAGLKSIVDDMVVPAAGALTGRDREALDAAITRFKAKVDEHQAWIDTELVPNARGRSAIGQELFDQKLVFTLNSTLTRADIRARAEAAVRRVHGLMYQSAKAALAGRAGAPATPNNPDAATQARVIRAALELAAAERPAPDQLVATSEAGLAEATAFVRQHDIITIPPDPVRVILMPEFQRGFAVAYCDSPGPFEQGQNTYYAVSPIPDGWTPEQATSFLREYNTRMITDIAIHEAMPGHYVQIGHARQEESKLRAMHMSGSFVEGWACYAEEAMVEAGFRANDPLFRLTQLKVQLRTITNAILDQMVQVDVCDEATAMRFMTEVAFQEEREAAGKWVRAQLSSTQLSTYFVGLEEHLAAREAARAKWGASFAIKRYHDGILSFGSPGVRFARALLLDEPIA